MTGTVLIDGFVGARWNIQHNRGATLTIAPFARLTRQDRANVIDEGSRLLAFAAADASRHDVRLLAPR